MANSGGSTVVSLARTRKVLCSGADAQAASALIPEKADTTTDYGGTIHSSSVQVDRPAVVSFHSKQCADMCSATQATAPDTQVNCVQVCT